MAKYTKRLAYISVLNLICLRHRPFRFEEHGVLRTPDNEADKDLGVSVLALGSESDLLDHAVKDQFKPITIHLCPSMEANSIYPHCWFGFLSAGNSSHRLQFRKQIITHIELYSLVALSAAL